MGEFSTMAKDARIRDDKEDRKDVPQLTIRDAAVAIEKTGLLSFFGKGHSEYWPVATISRKRLQYRTAEPLTTGQNVNLLLRVAGVRQTAKLKGVVISVKEQTRIGRTQYTHLIDIEFTEYTNEGWQLLRDIEEGKVGDVIR